MISENSQIGATQATKCAICSTQGNSIEIYSGNFSGEELDEKVFSARRFYSQKIHFRMVKCNSCGLVRSDPIVDNNTYSKLYERSNFTYDDQIKNLTKTYGYYLNKCDHLVNNKEALLEIGCGNGFFLSEAKRQGYRKVFGVEPSEDAINRASEDIKPLIKKGMFSKHMFFLESFDVICIFQTLDHFLYPKQVLSDVFELLRPGGIVLAINHNIDSFSAKILKEHSPIIDIEHTYLYNKKTITKLFEKNGFVVEKVFYPYNRHSLGYLFSLLPIRPHGLKKMIHKILDVFGLSYIPLFLPIGNLGIIVRKGK